MQNEKIKMQNINNFLELRNASFLSFPNPAPIFVNNPITMDDHSNIVNIITGYKTQKLERGSGIQGFTAGMVIKNKKDF